jgi:hypothetical protein
MTTNSISHEEARGRVDTSMMAWRVHEFGPPETMRFERVPRPEPGPGEVLVKVRAVGVGPWDGWIRAGRSALPQPLPLSASRNSALSPDAGESACGSSPAVGRTGERNPSLTTFPACCASAPSGTARAPTSEVTRKWRRSMPGWWGRRWSGVNVEDQATGSQPVPAAMPSYRWALRGALERLARVLESQSDQARRTRSTTPAWCARCISADVADRETVQMVRG